MGTMDTEAKRVINLRVTHDIVAGVYVGVGWNVDGLIVEAKTIEELRAEACNAIELLLKLKPKEFSLELHRT